MWVVLLAKFGGVPIGDDGKLGEVAILKILGQTFDAENLLCVRACHQARRLRLNDRNVGAIYGCLTQSHHEAAMVEGPSQGRGRRGCVLGVVEFDRLSKVCDMISVDLNRVDLLQTVLQTQLLQRLHTSGLEQFTDNAIGLLQRNLQQDHTPPLSSKRYCECTAQDSRADDHNVGLVVFDAAPGGLLRFRDMGVEDGGHGEEAMKGRENRD